MCHFLICSTRRQNYIVEFGSNHDCQKKRTNIFNCSQNNRYSHRIQLISTETSLKERDSREGACLSLIALKVFLTLTFPLEASPVNVTQGSTSQHSLFGFLPFSVLTVWNFRIQISTSPWEGRMQRSSLWCWCPRTSLPSPGHHLSWAMSTASATSWKRWKFKRGPNTNWTQGSSLNLVAWGGRV